MAPTGSTIAQLDQLELAADDIEHVLGFFVLVEQYLAGSALALGHERLEPFHREVAVDGFLHVAHQLQHLVQAIGVDQQHGHLHDHDQVVMGRNRSHDQDHVREDTEHPQRNHGLHRGGGDHEDRREQRARGSCVLCQMRRIHRKPTNIQTCVFSRFCRSARYRNVRGAILIYEERTTICRDSHHSRVKFGLYPAQPDQVPGDA